MARQKKTDEQAMQEIGPPANVELRPFTEAEKEALDRPVNPVGDPFFDDPPEKYWAEHSVAQHSDGSIFSATTDVHQTYEEFISLNTLMIPLTELRLRIAELQTSGIKKMPLGDLLLTIQDVYRENKDA